MTKQQKPENMQQHPLSLPPELHEEIEALRDNEIRESWAACVRRLIRAGIEALKKGEVTP